jgi:TatD DNase family protein
VGVRIDGRRGRKRRGARDGVTDFIDTHAHIHSDFEDPDGAIARANAAGVTRIVTLGVTPDDSRSAIAVAERHEGVFAAAGVHPHDAKDASDADLDALEELAASPKVALVGEIGLDFYRNLSPREVQRRVLLRQLETAARAGKPVAIHAREAHDEMYPVLETWSRSIGGALAGGRPVGVMHYFSADVDLALRYIELGFLISIHTSVTHPKAAMLQQVARDAPLASLVIETDSPYGAPHRYRGKRNEPAYVVEAAAQVAKLRGLSIEAVAGATTANALRLLG